MSAAGASPRISPWWDSTIYLFSRFTDPPLTSVRLPAVDLARQAADMLFQMLHGDEPERKQLILDTQLMVRESCGAMLPRSDLVKSGH